VDIPGTFAAYNRYYAEGRFSGLKEHFMTAALRRESTEAYNCVDCGKCEKHCPQNIPIRKELKNARKEEAALDEERKKGEETAAPESTAAGWDDGAPFLAPDEMADPRLLEWRIKMSRVHSSGWGKHELCTVDDPRIKKLIE
jgi:L-lactate utilization protein LutB